MKKNELVPVGNGESFTRCGWIRLALKTLFEDPHASFFVETIPLCVQLNLIVLLRLAIVGAFSLEIPRLFAVILGLFITTLIFLRKFILWIHCTLSGVGWATNAERKNYRCSLKIGETYRCRSACSRAGSKISVPAI